MRCVEKEDRNQIMLLPNSLEEYVTEENPVRVIDAFVDGLDIGVLSFERSVPDVMGRPPYDPRDLLKLYIYGYFNRIRSSRKLMQEDEAQRNALDSIAYLRANDVALDDSDNYFWNARIKARACASLTLQFMMITPVLTSS